MCAHIQHEEELGRVDRVLQFSWGSGEKGVGEDAGVTIWFPLSPPFYFFVPDAVVPGPGMQLWHQKQGLTIPLIFCARIPKGMIGGLCLGHIGQSWG